MTYFEVMFSYVPFRWGLEKLCLRAVKASVENVVGEDEVSTKTPPLERKKLQSTIVDKDDGRCI